MYVCMHACINACTYVCRGVFMMNLERFSTGLVLPSTQENESEMKTTRFGHVYGDFESGI